MEATIAHPHFGNVVISQITPRDRKMGNSPIDINISYINNLPYPVTVALRSGIKFNLNKQGSFTSNELVIRVEIKCNSSGTKDLKKVLSTVNENSSKELQVMRAIISNQEVINRHNTSIMIIDYPVTPDELASLGGSMYFHELDLLITRCDFDSCPPHPYSKEGMEIKLVNEKINPITCNGFNYCIELVDNLNKFGNRFINIGNEIYKLTSIQDSNKKDGIYLISNQSIKNAVSIDGINVKYYPLEDAKTLGIYKTFDEAKHLGDLSIAKKAELAELEHNTAIAKADAATARGELELYKLNLEKVSLERKAELESIAAERDRAKLAMETLQEQANVTQKLLHDQILHNQKMHQEKEKEEFDKRSHARKDTSEIMKWIPTVITGIFTIYIAISKLK